MLSTPHGTLGTIHVYEFGHWRLLVLSTPHGTLGTLVPDPVDANTYVSFNSTRYIRNNINGKSSSFGVIDFQLHTVH